LDLRGCGSLIVGKTSALSGLGWKSRLHRSQESQFRLAQNVSTGHLTSFTMADLRRELYRWYVAGEDLRIQRQEIRFSD